MADVTVQPSGNGPYVLTGNFKLVDSSGNEMKLEGHVFNGKVFLCRCGGSNTKPFCDGTHRKNNFQSVVKA